MLYQRLTDGPEPPQASGPGANAAVPPPPASGAASAFGIWDAAPDLERWLTSFYQYYELKGFAGVVAYHVTHLAAVAFTIVFSFWLFFFVNWQAVLSCHSEEACRNASLCFDRPFDEIGPRRCGVLLCFVLFFVYWVVNVTNALHTFRDASDMSHYYKERLGIVSDDILNTMLWSEVVSRLVQQQRAMPFCVVQDELTALEIANIIMREDNFVIALTNHQAFTSRLPRWIPARLAYTRAVLTCVRTAVFRWAFDSRGRVRQDFVENPAKLAKRLRWFGVLTLLLVLPVSIFVLLVFFMRHAEEFRSHRASPFRREWTDYAKWTFREFNEFPHQFKERMQIARTAAEEFASATRPSSPLRDSVLRFVKFAAGSVLAVLLLIALWDDSPLLFVKVQEKNLLWYLAFFGFLFAVADNSGEDGPPGVGGGRLLPAAARYSLGCAGAPLLMHVAMMRLVRCTHYLPTSWRAPAPLTALAGGCGGVQRARLCRHFEMIRSEFLCDLFVQRIQDLLEELVGVVLAPLLLIVYLPESAPDIVDVVRRSRYASANLGDWCVFGCMDPARSGCEFYSGPAWRLGAGDSDDAASCGSHRADGGGSTSSSAGEPARIVRSFVEPRLGCNGGKLEKSVLSFVLSHRLPWFAGPAPHLGCADDDDDVALSYDFAVGGGGGGRSSGTFRRAGASTSGDRRAERGANEPAFPMRDFGFGDGGGRGAQASNPPVVEPAARSVRFVDEEAALLPQIDAATSRAEVWGYPTCALTFLHDLEEFQQRETRPASAQRRLYKLFPEELLRLDRAAPVPGGPAVLPTAAAAPTCFGAPCGLGASAFSWPLDGQAEQASCSSHFFWLEVLYDFYSGRHASHLGDAGGGATFELLERADSDEPAGP